MDQDNEKFPAGSTPRSAKPTCEQADRWLLEVLRGNRERSKGGTYAVCSAHLAVIEAAIRQTLREDSILHVESTSSQVNQFGGYTGLTPGEFARLIRSRARAAGLPASRVLLGGDHLGPFPWRSEKADSALAKACQLVHDCVLAGYQKIHLDASMACADDPATGPLEKTVAQRAAILCRAAEDAFHKSRPNSAPPLYVIGTEVPAPGGESVDALAPAVTTPAHVHASLETFRLAFAEQEQSSAWERVIALVVQPGVDFGSNAIFDYDAVRAHSLSDALSHHPGLVFEAHSTDYQTGAALARMVRDHFAILKVGPWLTFAYREALLALSEIEREMFQGTKPRRLSQVRNALERVMLRDPVHWRSYYRGTEEQVRRDLTFAYSDRCRYYWHQSEVQEEVTRLLDNLSSMPIPLTLISQYFPVEYRAIRNGELAATSEQVIEYHIQQVLRLYADACAQ